MRSQQSRARRLLTVASVSATTLFGGCTVYQAPPPRVVYVQPAPAPAPVYSQPVPVEVEATAQPVVSVYVEPPVLQPEPILIGWAPPPMLVETVTPMPYAGAVWIGGYWVWEGRWVWAAGRWTAPPQPGYGWVHPYYENRDGAVVFITGHWCPPGVAFIPPPIGLRLTLVTPAIGVTVGVRPIGPPGVFVPAPPGSRAGLIVPAPIGTPPAVVTSAAPVINVGMRIQSNTSRVTNTTNTTTINNVTNVTIVAPANATANGRAYESAVPAQAHLAAALPPVVRMNAPPPTSSKPIPAYTATRGPVALPPPQIVRTGAMTPPPRPTDSTAVTSSTTQNTSAATAPGAPRDRAAERSAQVPAAAPAGAARVAAADKAQPAQTPVLPRAEGKAKGTHEQGGRPAAEHAAKSEHQAKRSEDGDKERGAR